MTQPPQDNADTVPSDTQDSQQGSQLDAIALLERVKRQFQEARNASATWRKDAREDYGFYAGEQWGADDVARLKEQLRPVVTFNRVAPTVDTVAGMEINNRQEIRCYPRGTEDVGPNEMLSHAVKWVRDECDAEDEESDVFVDSVICGMGWTETRLDYDRDPDGMIVQERIDPLEMFWDPYARKRNLADARYVIHRKEIDTAEARAMFPNVDPADLHAAWAASDKDEQGAPHDQSEARYYNNDQTANERMRRKVTILHVQWIEKEPFYRVADPTTGQVTKLSEDKFAIAKQRLAQMMPGINLPAVRQTRKVVKRAFVGAVVLDVGDGPCKDDFTFECVTGKRDRNAKTWYGIVRGMKDPQRWANKFFATILHTIATSGKGILAAKDAFDNPRQAENDWAKPDSITWLKGGIKVDDRIMPKPASQLPAGLPDMLQFSLSSLRDVSGVNMETMGNADRDQAASLEWQRRKSAFSILAAFFDGLRHYRKRQGRLLIYFIQNYISDGRLMRIEGQDGNPQYIPLIRDPQAAEYDVIVDDAPSSPDQKESTWLIMGQLLPLLARLPVPPAIWAEILKASPLPETLTLKLGQIIDQAGQQQPAPDPKMLLAQAQIQALQQKSQIAQQDAQQSLAMKQAEHQMSMDQQQQAAQLDAHHQVVKAQGDMAIEQARFQHDIAIEQADAANRLQLEREKAAMQNELAQQKFAAQKAGGAFNQRSSGN